MKFLLIFLYVPVHAINTNSFNTYNPHHTLNILAREHGSPIIYGRESGYKIHHVSIISLRQTNILDVSVYGFHDTYSPNPRIEITTIDRIATGHLIAARSYRLTSTLVGVPISGFVGRSYMDTKKEIIKEKPSRLVKPGSKEFFDQWFLSLSRLVYVPRDFYHVSQWD